MTEFISLVKCWAKDYGKSVLIITLVLTAYFVGVHILHEMSYNRSK